MSDTMTTKDTFSAIANGFDEIHSSIERLTPMYVQSWMNLQQEYMEAWKKIVCSNIGSQQQYAKKIGMNSNSISFTNQIIQEMTEEITRAMEFQGKWIQTFFEVSRQNINGIRQSVEVYSELNKKLQNR
jgi:hypothetical protein